MIRIGLTGGVGTGKSTIAAFMQEEYGAKIIIADTLGHQVMCPGTEVYSQIIEVFGTAVVDGDGGINRGRLSELVFADRELLLRLNAIIHPAVRKEVLRQLAEFRDGGGCSCVLIETAILEEAGYQEFCDEVWYVEADAAVRRQRLKQSRAYSDAKIDAVFANQNTEAQFRKIADFVITNSGEPAMAQAQIRRRMEEIQQKNKAGGGYP